jgi:hypothetical protein
MVSQDSQITFSQAQPMILQLAQKVQQAQKSAAESAAAKDPTAQVLLKTQMAETERKAQEAQARMQQDMAKQQQDYQLKVAELQRKVQELSTKYGVQSDIDSQKNSTDIVLANINNASRERVAAMGAGAQLDGMQMQLEAEQAQSAIQAINAADEDIRKHGLAIEEQVFEQQADAVRAAIEAQQQPPQGAI